jgi:NAD(P)-dependent dehydrogenase (short-subunit alcohol dehydrogenase family)
MKELKGVPAIVTGGGSGIGAEVARTLAKAGCKVSVWDANKAAATKIIKEIGGLALECDVSDAKSVESAIKKSRDTNGPARILVNCAGILIPDRVVGKNGPADFDKFSKVIDVNLKGTFNTMRMAAADMTGLTPVTASGERGVIINTASIAAFEGQIGQAAYSASKGGVVSMTLPAARELARFGIRIMAIAPGVVETPMVKSISEDFKKSIEASIPFPSRMAKPEELAELVMHIISNEMLNGEVIRMDGATRLAPK